MPNVCVAAGLRLAAAGCLVLTAGNPLCGQTVFAERYQAGPGRSFGYSPWDVPVWEDSPPAPRVRGEAFSAGHAVVSSDVASSDVVSSDVLRHPLTSKARRVLEKAMRWAELGDHPAAIRSLNEAMAQVPSATPYVHNLLGLEYMANEQFAEARNSFEEAVRLMPHEAGNHSNLGLSLAIAGDWNSAEQEARRAVQLDPSNSRAKSLLDLLLLHKRKVAAHTP